MSSRFNILRFFSSSLLDGCNSLYFIFACWILESNFILPTSDKSYRSLLKNKFWNKFSAASFVGGSPGRIILYISTSASILSDEGSILKVFDMYAPLSKSFTNRTLILSILFSIRCSMSSAVKISLAAANISPVSSSIISCDNILLSKYSIGTINESVDDFFISFTCLAVIRLPLSAIIFFPSLISKDAVSPLNLSGISFIFIDFFDKLNSFVSKNKFSIS